GRGDGAALAQTTGMRVAMLVTLLVAADARAGEPDFDGYFGLGLGPHTRIYGDLADSFKGTDDFDGSVTGKLRFGVRAGHVGLDFGFIFTHVSKTCHMGDVDIHQP